MSAKKPKSYNRTTIALVWSVIGSGVVAWAFVTGELSVPWMFFCLFGVFSTTSDWLNRTRERTAGKSLPQVYQGYRTGELAESRAVRLLSSLGSASLMSGLFTLVRGWIS